LFLDLLSPAGLRDVGVWLQLMPRPLQHVLPFYLHINSSIDHLVMLGLRKMRAGKSEKHKRETIKATKENKHC